MGHSIGGGFLKATNKEAALREALRDAEEFAFYEVDRGENPSGRYHGNMRFYDRTFNNEDDAMDFFDSLGPYRDGVCLVKEPSRATQTRYQKQVTKIQTKKAAMREAALEAFKQRTSATIGCKKCGTRIASEVALKRRLTCPNCGNWLVTDSYKARYAKLDEALNLAEEQYKKDIAETGKPRYWAKYEVHT